MISNRRYWFLLFLVAVVYAVGMFATLFENDSAQFAVMAMRMYQENDFLHLFKGPEEYLDKPHMHYWLAAISFKIFGLHDWAYRIPGILASFLAAYSCYGLGKLLYNANVGKLAAIIFLTAQTIVLANIDVRTDAVLTGFTIFSIWQLAVYIQNRSIWAIVLGALGAGLAFSTKGQISLLVIGFPILCHLAYTREWKALWNWKVLVALAVFAISIMPMLYAYYIQFDLHPEKVIRGKGGRTGAYFIFWEQSFERLSGDGHGKNSSDYFFFFHTFLWVFIPWTVIALLGYWFRVKTFVKLKFAENPKYEFLTIGGITLIFFVISFAQFKLPHYLNITIPLFSILSASYLYSVVMYAEKKVFKILLGVQYFLMGVVFIFCSLVCFYVFKVNNPILFVCLFVFFGICVFYLLKREAYYLRVITTGVITSVLLNFVLNAHFYPELLKYQGGSNMAEVVKENNISVDNIYKFTERHTWALDFYNKRPVQITTLEKLKGMKGSWVYVDNKELDTLRSEGFDWDQQFMVNQFRITRLQAKFLNPVTRGKILNQMHLVHLK